MAPPKAAFLTALSVAAAVGAGCGESGTSEGDGTSDVADDAVELAADDAGPIDAVGDPDAGDGQDANTDAWRDIAGDAGSDPLGDAPPTFAESFRLVHVDATLTPAEQLSVHACAGLYNRRLGGSIFVQTDPDVPQASIDGAMLRDELWLAALNLTPSATIEARPFLQECLDEAAGCVRYSYSSQHEILPGILTVAAAHGVPPLADESALRCDAPVLDATDVFADRVSQLDATQYVYENYLHQTTGMAMLNPGYDRLTTNHAAPDLIDDMPVALVDLVFSRRLFVAYLINGCVDGNPEEELLARIVNESPWPRPVGVFGYNDSWLIGGYMYEAQTRCLPSSNMGAIPTRTTNLSFFDTRRLAIAGPEELPGNPPQSITYDPTRTYVAFVIGDGDNVRYIMSTRRDWLEQRLERCRDAAPACPPLNWTFSPHLPDLAPDVVRWYYEQASTTGADFFMLPPSGFQYAYPGRMPDDDQARFASATENAARILHTHSVVHWEWFDGWNRAVERFLPRYAHDDGQIRGIFPVNVPYPLEAFPNWPFDQTYRVLTGADGGQAVLFRPESWRGVDGRDEFHPTPQAMADRLVALPLGTVTWVYMTSDGGLTLENSYGALTELLPDHIVLVSADAAAELAIEASAR